MAAVRGLSKIQLARNPRHIPNGSKAYARAMAKYTFNPTRDSPYAYVDNNGQSMIAKAMSLLKTGQVSTQSPKMVKRNTDGSMGEVPAEDIQNDAQYLAPVLIGTPAQTLNLDFDTGSADLWVWSTELQQSLIESGQSSGHTIFNPVQSSTFSSESGETWQIQYGDGSTASGNVGTDTVSLAGLTIQGQGVELAQQLSASFQQGAGDGLLGLAWPSINTAQPTPVKTPVENLIDQSVIPSNAQLFTAYLTNYQDNTQPFYTFGEIDQDVLQANGGQVNYTSVDNSQGFWMFSSTSSSVNGQEIQISGGSAIADTGTTLALVDDQTCEAIYNAIPGATYDSSQGGYVFPSSVTTDQLPTVTLDIGGNPVTIHKEDIAFSDAGNNMTFGGIQSRGDMTFSIFGDVVLKAIYAVFDQGNVRFGFVQRADPSSTSN